MYDLTAAHRSLPFGTKVRVTNRANGKSVVVRINDRGPYVGERVIDLSRGAAQAVNMTETGTAPAKLEVLPTIQEECEVAAHGSCWPAGRLSGPPPHPEPKGSCSLGSCRYSQGEPSTWGAWFSS